MYTVPEDFRRRLEREFDGRLRVRYSYKRHTFEVEQKINRSKLPPIGYDQWDDDHIRAREGYMYLMSLSMGTVASCPICGLDVKVPLREFIHRRCEYCKFKGRNQFVSVGFWPLDDLLIEELKRLDPLRRDLTQVAKEADLKNERLLESMQRAADNEIENRYFDQINRLLGIEQVGYTGKEFKG